jgi:hypothetical protein
MRVSASQWKPGNQLTPCSAHAPFHQATMRQLNDILTPLMLVPSRAVGICQDKGGMGIARFSCRHCPKSEATTNRASRRQGLLISECCLQYPVFTTHRRTVDDFRCIESSESIASVTLGQSDMHISRGRGSYS